MILAAAKGQGKKAEAAQYCRDYCQNGIEKGTAFLFSGKELEKAYPFYKTVNQSFSELGDELLSDWLWSSSEYSKFSAWIQRISDGYIGNYYGKNSGYCVRPGLKFEC